MSQEDNLTLWQMHLDGTYRRTIVESMKREQAAADPSGTLAPTGAIMTDNMNGLLLPVRWPRNSNHTPSSEPAEELIYRIDPEGHVVYKLPVPPSTGYPTDEMVIVDNELGFATSGSFLIAVN